jgi:hypothetical protein
VNPCAYCGEDRERFGTMLEAQLFIEDRTFALQPSFCSWQHAAAWFNQSPPDVSAWEVLKAPRAVKIDADGGVGTWLILGLLILLILAAAVLLGITLN